MCLHVSVWVSQNLSMVCFITSGDNVEHTCRHHPHQSQVCIWGMVCSVGYIFSYENRFSLLKLLTKREVVRGHSWIEKKKKGIMQARADRYKQSSKFVLTSGSTLATKKFKTT